MNTMTTDIFLRNLENDLQHMRSNRSYDLRRPDEWLLEQLYHWFRLGCPPTNGILHSNIDIDSNLERILSRVPIHPMEAHNYIRKLQFEMFMYAGRIKKKPNPHCPFNKDIEHFIEETYANEVYLNHLRIDFISNSVSRHIHNIKYEKNHFHTMTHIMIDPKTLDFKSFIKANKP